MRAHFYRFQRIAQTLAMRQFQLKRLLPMRLIALILIIGTGIFGYPNVGWAETKPQISRLWVLEDPSNSMDLSQAKASNDWKLESVTGYAGNYTKSAFWIRLELTGKPGQTLVLTLLPSFLDDVRFYIPQDAIGERLQATKSLIPIHGGLALSQQGDFSALSNRAFDWRAFSVDLVIPKNGERLEVMARIATGSTSLIHPEVFTPDEFLAKRKRELLYFLIEAGFTLAAIAVAFFLYLTYQEKIFVVYLIYATSSLFWFFMVNGFASQLLPISPMTISNLLGFVVCLFVASSAVFMAQIIDTKRHAPRVYQAILVLSTLMAMAAPLALLDWYRYFVKPMILVIVLEEVVLAIVCIRVFAKGLLPVRSSAVIYLAALLSNVALIGGFLGAFTPPNFTILLLQIIIFIDLLVLLPLAVSRVENLRKQRERDERELSRAQEALRLQEEINLSHRKWVSMITHEIKTPLSVIDASRQTIDTLTTDNEVLGRTAKIARATHRIDALVNSFLAEDEIAQRSQLIHPQKIDSATFLNKVLEHLPQPVLDCLTVKESQFQCDILADPDLLAVALRNLLDNAYRHGSGNPIWLEVEDHHQTAYRCIVFRVGNSGFAISEEAQKQLFQRYYRNGENAGSGIGLWASREIAQAHGGNVSYRRSEHGENVFALWVPVSS